ncbi:hypothetical protein [Sphingopyxis sp. H115]|uniref:hypothetical protein n=1 Tax=Sphingopyxis sp. H115 TaxID=1759073 RepID=UPI000735F4D2|nr:hypothetical protein [Sphingopyxis sp. H115]KTE16878.1 hypothetical protein ATE71_04795 [Sphingopyxis sp. H115]
MADYFSQIVVRPDIPKTAMTALEYVILATMFDAEPVGEDVYFSASDGVSDFVLLDVAEVKRMIAAEEGIASSVTDVVREGLEKLDPEADEFEVDMSMVSFEGIFEDVVKRSALDYIEIETAWSCSKMRPDGFGGAATLISKSGMVSMSTASFLEEAIGALSLGPPTG